MPEIIGQKERQEAMREIRSALKVMVSTNQFLDAVNTAGKYTVIFDSDKGEHRSAIAFTERKEEIDHFVCQHKRMVADRVKFLAERNGIALYPEEKQVLGITLTDEEQEELVAKELAALEAAEEDV